MNRRITVSIDVGEQPDLDQLDYKGRVVLRLTQTQACTLITRLAQRLSQNFISEFEGERFEVPVDGAMSMVVLGSVIQAWEHCGNCMATFDKTSIRAVSTTCPKHPINE